MTNILLFGYFILECYYSRRSPAPSPSPTIVTTPPPQNISIRNVTTPITIASPEVLLQQSRDRLTQINSPMTRTEFLQRYGQSLFNRHKYRWDGAKRGERR